ncbi:hypothetical protein [Allokutzneria sp. NRRL B-24872]|uniref:hypothetical protein n=1 Tax=Allokutzneria sp. NRRL B-24872 TaxID=1137961 RepID=UPI000A38A164|nr:hypothetical protein [Allokutzneria sp. NRRL B-24872]
MNREFRDEDIRDLLGGALGSEPPMTIDRASVIQAGKRSLRRRRLVAGAGVAAGVVAVALGATALAGPSALFGGPDLGPAGPGPASTSTTGPATPETTRPPYSTTTVRTSPSTDAPAPRIALSPRDPKSAGLVAQYNSAYSAASPLPHWAEPLPRAPKFELVDGGMRLAAELKDSQGLGEFRIEVFKSASPSVSQPCRSASTPAVVLSCEPVDMGELADGRRVNGFFSAIKTGAEITHTLSMWRPDGLEIVATSTNARLGVPGGVNRAGPTLSKANLRQIVLTPGFVPW